MSYTIKNLRDIEDVAPRFGFDTIQEARFARQELDAQDTGFAYHVIKPDNMAAPIVTRRPRRSMS